MVRTPTPRCWAVSAKVNRSVLVGMVGVGGDTVVLKLAWQSVRVAAVSAPSTPSCAKTTAWWPSTPTPHSASWGARVDPHAVGSYWDLAADEHLDTFADVRTRVGNNIAGLFVLAGEASTPRRHVLDPAIYREAASRLDRHFTISIVDCGSTLDSPVTQEVLRDLDALIVVSSPWVDGASAAGQILEWLANRGLTDLDLLQRTVVVLNDSDGTPTNARAPSWRSNSTTTAWWSSRCPSIRTCARAG